MIQKVLRLLALLILAGNSFSDIRRHTICPALTLAGGMAGLAAAVWRAVPPLSFALSIMPGGVLCLLSLMTRGAVGVGDGLLMLSLAGYFDCGDILMILLGGLLPASAYAGRELLKGAGGKRSFAFVPFLLGGYVLYLIAVSV